MSVIDVKFADPAWDAEVNALSKILARGGWAPHEVQEIHRAAHDRAEQVRAGLTSPTAVYWTERIQREIDDRTRMRWDFTNGWTIDRWASGCWEVVGVLGHNRVMFNLIDYLRERDMQRWPSPQAYLEHKRQLAFKRQIENWKIGNEKLGAVIDRMSDRQIIEFIQVERAMQTGEAINMRGDTLRMYERMREASGRSPAPPSNRGINPGHRFKVLTRRTGGAHRLQ